MAAAVARADALLDVGRYREAAAVLTEALARQPDDAHALVLLAFSLLRDDPERALPIVNHALVAAPDYSYAHGLRADVLRRLERYPEAVQAAEVAVRLAPDDASMHRTLCRCLYAVGDRRDLERARRAADRALALAPEDPDSHVVDGFLRDWTDGAHRARRSFERALALQPDHAGARSGLAWLDLSAGRAGAAAHGFADAVRAGVGTGQGADFVADFHRALREWAWRRCYVLAALVLLTTAPMVSFVPHPIGYGLGAAALTWYTWHLRRSQRALPQAAVLALRQQLRRPRQWSIVAAAVLALALVCWLAVALTVPLPLLLVLAVPAVPVVTVFLARGNWRDLWRDRFEGLG